MLRQPLRFSMVVASLVAGLVVVTALAAQSSPLRDPEAPPDQPLVRHLLRQQAALHSTRDRPGLADPVLYTGPVLEQKTTGDGGAQRVLALLPWWADEGALSVWRGGQLLERQASPAALAHSEGYVWLPVRERILAMEMPHQGRVVEPEAEPAHVALRHDDTATLTTYFSGEPVTVRLFCRQQGRAPGRVTVLVNGAPMGSTLR